jgi:hypothetical protein
LARHLIFYQNLHIVDRVAASWYLGVHVKSSRKAWKASLEGRAFFGGQVSTSVELAKQVSERLSTLNTFLIARLNRVEYFFSHG